ncbi:MAG: ATP-binding protein [Janthinobacterium lividum]
MAVQEPICLQCGGSGQLLVERDGGRVVRECSCRIERRQARTLARARIPARYEHCSIESFDPAYPSATRSLQTAFRTARKFVESYPIDTAGNGLLFTGSIGVGKTHLAVGILQALVQERGATGLFYDYRDLLKQVQNTYSSRVHATESEILKPVFDAEVLILDELGAAKPTDWVWDTVAHILNTRYNDRRTTIITTNYANLAPAASLESNSNEFTRSRAASREETLGDRIGERMRSRLQEMCVVVEVNGADFRQTVNLARFS